MKNLYSFLLRTKKSLKLGDRIYTKKFYKTYNDQVRLPVEKEESYTICIRISTVKTVKVSFLEVGEKEM